MAVARDAAGGTAGGGPTTSINWSHTTGAGATLLLVGINVQDFTPIDQVSGITFGADVLSLFHAYESTNGFQRVEIWGIVNPTIQTATITVSWAANVEGVVGESQSFTGSDTTTPTNNAATATGAGTSSSLAITSAINDMTFDSIVRDFATNAMTPGGGQTLTAEGAGTATRGGGSTTPGAASNTHTWSWVNSRDWSMLGCNVRAATAPPANIRRSRLPVLGVGP